MKTKRLLFAALLLFGASLASYAQTLQVNPITTAVPFLTNTPDARGASLGFSGVATSPDAFSMFYNPAKYAFMSNDHTMIASGFNAFTTFPDQYMLYDAFAQRIGNSVIAATARYHRCGDVVLYDAFHQNLGSYRPQEFAVDVAYSYRFGVISWHTCIQSVMDKTASNTSRQIIAKTIGIGNIHRKFLRPIGSKILVKCII